VPRVIGLVVDLGQDIMPLSIMTKAHEDSIKTVKTWRAEKFPTPVRHRWSHKRAN